MLSHPLLSNFCFSFSNLLSKSTLLFVNMNHKTVLCWLILFLGFFYLLFAAAAVPTSRSLKSIERDSTVHELLPQGLFDMGNNEGLLEEREGYIEGRMDIESLDYPGTGANNHHDPKPPGRV